MILTTHHHTEVEDVLHQLEQTQHGNFLGKGSMVVQDFLHPVSALRDLEPQ